MDFPLRPLFSETAHYPHPVLPGDCKVLRHGERGIAESVLPQPARVLSVPPSRWSPGRSTYPLRPPLGHELAAHPAGSELGALLQPAAWGGGGARG